MDGAVGAKDRVGDGFPIRRAQGFVAALAVYAIGIPLALLVGLALLPRPVIAFWLAVSMFGPVVAAMVARRRGATVLDLAAGRRSEPAQVIIRLFLPGVILAYLLGLAAIGVERTRLLPLVALDIAATLYVWILLADLLLQPRGSSLRRWVAMLSDVGLVSMFLHFGAALSVPWFSLYFWIVLGFGVAPRAIAAAAAATLLGFAAVYAATPYWQERPGLSAGVALALVLLPAHMANLLRRLAPSAAWPSRGSPSRDATAAGRTARDGPLDILLAEKADEERSLRPMLETAGHHVTAVANGDAAFSLLERRRFDLALINDCDGMGGCEMARLYRLEHLGDGRLPIIAVAADGAADTQARCHDAGIDTVLARPFEAGALLAAIDETVARLAAPPAAAPSTTTPRSADESTAVVDDDVIRALRMLGGREFVAEVGDAFRAEARRLVVELQRSAGIGDAAGFARRLDSLYGGAVNIGAARLCHALATMRDAGTADLRDRGAGYVARLRRELEALDLALDAAEAKSRPT